MISRRAFIATLAAALVAPRLPLPVPTEPPLSPFWSSTLPPDNGVLTFEMLQECIDNIIASCGKPPAPLIVPPYWAKVMASWDEDAPSLRQFARSAPGDDDDAYEATLTIENRFYLEPRKNGIITNIGASGDPTSER